MILLDALTKLMVNGLIPDTAVFHGARALLPQGDGPFWTLTLTGGPGSSKTQNDTATGRPTVQVRAAAGDATTSWNAIMLAWIAFGGENGLYNIVLDSYPMFISIVPGSTPADIGLDDEERPCYSFNLAIEQSPN